MSCFVGFGDKNWDNFKNFFQTQGFGFLFLSQKARRAAFWRLDSAENARLETQLSLSVQAASCNRE